MSAERHFLLTGWLGLIAVSGLPFFGPLFCVVCLAFLTPAEWRGITLRLARLFRLSELAPKEAGEIRRVRPRNVAIGDVEIGMAVVIEVP